MALDPVPWFIGGGAEHSPEVARLLAYAATSGSNGVTLAGDLHVNQLPTPGPAVRVAIGTGVLLNQFPGGGRQSYLVRNTPETEVPIPATGSSGGAVRYVIVRIDDPQYAGQAPVDPRVGPYVRFAVVSSVANLNYPHLVLCRIDQPANTATITNLMITDLREVANPREKTLVYPRPNVTNDAGMVLTSRQAYPDGEWFPNVGGTTNNGVYRVDIPEWATRMQIRMEWLSIRYSNNPGYGQYWVTYGPDAGTPDPDYRTQAFAWDSDDSTNRVNWVLHQEVAVPAAIRGTSQPFVARANKTSPTSYAGKVELTALSGMVFSVRFLEVAA
jgi:hypothetical protein